MNVDSMMQSFSRGIIRYRWPLLALITLITVGLISLASVLVPMVFIMGLMGWTKIPLDFEPPFSAP